MAFDKMSLKFAFSYC